VASVPIPKASEWTPRYARFTLFALPGKGLTVTFEPNKSVFNNPDAASSAISQIAHYLVVHRDAKIELTGTTPHAGTFAFDVALSEARAYAVKVLLVKQGVYHSQVATRGVGWRFRTYVNDQGPDGTLLPGPAAHNQSVIVSLIK
jgi:outer membrane protein OmpA-like peptidoglycan-associated protein